MIRHTNRLFAFSLGMIALLTPLAAQADQTFAEIAETANEKVVKLYGSGGFLGLPSYGSGVLVSADGYVLTLMNHLLDTRDLRVHLADGRRFNQLKVVAVEPVLDVALVKIEGVKNLPYFDWQASLKKPVLEPGMGVLAFSNQFQIATRNEPLSVQRGVIAAYAKLQGHRGVFEAPYSGEVYFVDAITNNPGAAGGALTTRKGELIGLVGKEMRNKLTGTWVNYALPLQATGKGKRKDTEVNVSLADMLKTVILDNKAYVSTDKREKVKGQGGYHGLVLVPDVLERTPPYVEEIDPNSPAAKAGFRSDDLIVYIDGVQVPSIKVFKEIMGGYPPGSDPIAIEVQRGQSLQSLKITLEKQPEKKK